LLHPFLSVKAEKREKERSFGFSRISPFFVLRKEIEEK